MAQKVIVTNFSALTGKYGQSGIQEIKSALDAYVLADQERGNNTVIVPIDDAKTMKAYGNKTVTDAANEKQNKDAIDAVYAKLQPDYLVLLGATDVIPHQSLKNLMFNPPNDPDEFALSDLPYACDVPYGQEPGGFNAPTRVVGRIPDLTGSKDPQYMIDLLNTYSSWTQKPSSAYSDYLGLTALVWQGSTSLSLNNIFGNDSEIQTSPTAGPNWSTKFISRLAHFINCHGSPIDPFYYGQESSNYPQAHAASFLESTPDIQEGTVVAAECCYGAELYDPNDAGQMGICNTYLKRKAYGFLGSSTIAYGPADSNSDADLICQYFLKHVLEGSSTGRATLEARLDFIQESGLLDPVNLKTLCQFNLMGDPSIVPVTIPKSEKAPKAMRGVKGMDFEQTQRRVNLKAVGEALGRTVPVAKRLPIPKGGQAPSQTALKQILKQEKISSPKVMSFQIAAPASPLFRSTKRSLEIKSGPKAKTLPNRVHVVFETITTPKAVRGVKGVAKTAPEKIPPHGSALVAWEHDGKIISYRKVFQH